MQDIKLIDSYQAHLPVQYGSNMFIKGYTLEAKAASKN